MSKKIEISPELRAAFAEVGRIGGKLGGAKGGKASAAKLTPEQRTERAKKAAAASAKVRTAKAKAKREGKGA